MRKVKFTLIEILVVCSVIGILASMVLPALRDARDSAKAAICLGNERQIGVAITIYLEDSDGYFPTTEIPDISWDDRLGMGYDGRKLTNDQLMSSTPGYYSLYHCPADQIPVNNSNRARRTYSINHGSNNDNNNKRRGVAGDGDSLRIGEVGDPSNGIMIFEYQFDNNQIGAGARAERYADHLKNTMDEASAWQHGFWKMNYLMVDGSARSETFEGTFLGLRSPWGSTHDVRDTMWDCMK